MNNRQMKCIMGISNPQFYGRAQTKMGAYICFLEIFFAQCILIPLPPSVNSFQLVPICRPPISTSFHSVEPKIHMQKTNKTKMFKQSKKRPKIKSTKIALDSFGVGQLFLGTRTTLKCVIKITSISTRVTMAVMEQNTTACWWLFYSSLLTLLQCSPSSTQINTWRLILS